MRLVVRRSGDGGHGEADHLAQATVGATDGIAEKEDSREIGGSEGGAAKGLAGAVPAADRDTTGEGDSVEGSLAVRGAGAVSGLIWGGHDS